MPTHVDCPLCKERLDVHSDQSRTVAHHVARECLRASRVREHLAGDPGPDGVDWAVAADDALIQHCESGTSTLDIARMTGISVKAIEARLDKLRLAGCIV